jgi:hypothetical protein
MFSSLLRWLSSFRNSSRTRTHPEHLEHVAGSLREIEARLTALEDAMETLAAEFTPAQTRHARQQVEALRLAVERAKRDARGR